MDLHDEAVEEFQRIWKQEHGEDITKAQAREYGENLLNFFKILIEIDQDQKFKSDEPL